jgi:NADH:ubiquinone oxidoreductase subunit 5 (subunit L)/multisubunit Na+/H+ antiporter MnhA subunit
MLKSAQFPFHSWLPDTMEAPTPVSALMHAGIINAGGFLIIRLSPIVALSAASLLALALCGAFTALFASLVMLTHASVKRSLAFSTVAQMGFMMLECGLGAFGPAVLHLVAHSLYKAHAFLGSGGAVDRERSGGMAIERVPANRFLFEGAFAVFFGGSVLLLIFGLHRYSGLLLDAGALPPEGRAGGWGPYQVAAVLSLFFCVMIARLAAPMAADTRLLRSIYVHARNGFYINTVANRFVASVWPLER